MCILGTSTKVGGEIYRLKLKVAWKCKHWFIRRLKEYTKFPAMAEVFVDEVSKDEILKNSDFTL